MALRPRQADTVTLSLVEESGRNVQRATMLLRDLITGWPDQADLAREIVLAEQEGDRIAHDLIHRLNMTGAGRQPFDTSDGYALATALDDIVDFAEQAADEMIVYGVEATMEQAHGMAEILVACGEQVALALRALRSGNELGPHLVEIHRLENEGDRLRRDAVASLFANGIDPMVVIRWKDIFASLEASVDACEKVAHVLEGITLKQRH